ncbi:hypothetical protein JHD93_20545 [Cronobacter sakazakii]|uniref:hypothetical protein n=1 Tax=Cronobacter sakazakii TaxID=28141 RepID=UPI00190CB3AA|nr:hypothetical protein [Cronobacter sakazakii]MBK4114537.1 hypothetical protein [Cronobacter sakazakii]
MSTLSILGPLGVGIIAWTITGCTVSGSMQEKKHNKITARISGILAGAVAGFICLIIAVLMLHDSDSTESSESVANVTLHSDAPRTFPIDITTLTTRINNNLKILGSDFKVHFLSQKLEHNTTSKYMFDDNNGIIVTADNQSGLLTGIVIVTQGDGTMKGGFNVLHVLLSTFSAILGEDEMKKGKASDIVIGLIEKKYPNDEANINNVHFSVLNTKEGLMTFFISPVN